MHFTKHYYLWTCKGQSITHFLDSSWLFPFHNLQSALYNTPLKAPLHLQVTQIPTKYGLIFHLFPLIPYPSCYIHEEPSSGHSVGMEHIYMLLIFDASPPWGHTNAFVIASCVQHSLSHINVCFFSRTTLQPLQLTFAWHFAHFPNPSSSFSFQTVW